MRPRPPVEARSLGEGLHRGPGSASAHQPAAAGPWYWLGERRV